MIMGGMGLGVRESNDEMWKGDQKKIVKKEEMRRKGR